MCKREEKGGRWWLSTPFRTWRVAIARYVGGEGRGGGGVSELDHGGRGGVPWWWWCVSRTHQKRTRDRSCCCTKTKC